MSNCRDGERSDIEKQLEIETGLMLHWNDEPVYKHQPSIPTGEVHRNYYLYPLDGDSDPWSDTVPQQIAVLWTKLVEARELIAHLTLRLEAQRNETPPRSPRREAPANPSRRNEEG